MNLVGRAAASVAVLLAGCRAAVPGAGAPAALPDVHLVPAFPGLRFSRPVLVATAGDGTGRLYVVEQKRARILSFVEDPAAGAAEVFVDLADRVNAAESEQGLLALAFHPDYRANRRLFVFYTAAAPLRVVLEELRASADGSSADPASGRVLLEVTKPYPNHNGGALLFGPDGYLYVGLGDGGLGPASEGKAQDLGSLLGKVLRIDVDRSPGYAIPADNPHAATAGARPEIWASGLRNPWRMSFDPETLELWAGDVGQDAWEEIDVIVRGGNYGWDLREGRHPFQPVDPFQDRGDRSRIGPGSGDPAFIEPVLDYPHRQGACVIGGQFYRGARVPELRGAYVFADYISGRIWALRRERGRVSRVRVIATQEENIASFGEGNGGELYLCAFDGRIYRLEPGRGGGDATPTP